ERIATQAQREGMPLSAAEQHMLRWSETDPEFEIEPDLEEPFEEPQARHDFEARIKQLLKRAYDADMGTDPASEGTFREAVKALAGSDQYLLLMIDPSIGVERSWLWRHTYWNSARVAL